MIELRPGIYQHYKGPLYRVGNLAHDANYEGRVVVNYIAIEQDGAHSGYPDAVRTLEDFTSIVMIGDNQFVPRFRFIAPDRNEEVMEIIRLRERDKLETYAQTVISMRDAARGETMMDIINETSYDT